MRSTTHPWAPKISPDVAWVSVDGEVVAIDPIAGDIHLINSTGALLWSLFDGTATVAELATDIADVFEIALDDAFDQVNSFASRMVEASLVVGPEVREQSDVGVRAAGGDDPEVAPTNGPLYLVKPPDP